MTASTEKKGGVDNNSKSSATTEIIEISGENLRDKIYEIRGEKVMLDFDLAKIYGYTTSAFNQQVKNNIEKFDEDFMFRLTRAELDILVRCKNLISKNLISKDGRGGSRHLPYAFTEQGIYMLMTVLKGELATRQSKTLIRTFRAMKDFIIENREALEQKEQIKMLMQVTEHSRLIVENSQQLAEHSGRMMNLENEMNKVEDKIDDMSQKINNAVMRSELAPVLLDFKELPEKREYLIWNGQPMRAKETYLEIFSKAKKSVTVIDNYIDIRTLRLMGQTKKQVRLVVLSDNLGGGLHVSDYKDFAKEFPDKEIEFYKTNGAMHDRFVIIDDEKVFHCGSSVKDAGNRLTMIMELNDGYAKKGICGAAREMMAREKLRLR